MAKKKAKRKISTKTKATRLVKRTEKAAKREGEKVKRGTKKLGRRAKKAAKREGKKVKRGTKKIGRRVKKTAKRVGKKAKKFAKTDTGRATIGAGAGALLLGPIGAIAGAAAGLATRKKNPMSLSPKANIVRQIFQLEQSIRHNDPQLASRLRKKHKAAFDYLERRAKVGQTIKRTHPMYMPIVELHSELSRRGNPEQTVKIASVVGSLMIDYHKASPTIEHVAASALRGERVELSKVKTARMKLKSLIRLQKRVAEREQLEDVVEALDKIISKAMPRGRNPVRAFSLEAQVKSIRRSKVKKSATGIASRSKVYGEVKRKSTASKLRKINPDTDLPSTLDDLTDKYRRARKRWLAVSTKTSSTAGEISRSRKRMDDAENKLVLFAEIRNMSPDDLRRYMLHAQKMQAKAKRAHKRTPNPSVSVHEQKAQRYFALAMDKLKRARKSGNVSSWLSTMSTATRASTEFENAGAPEKYALAAFDIQSEAMSAIEQKCMASPRMRASLNPPRGIKLLHIPSRATKKKIRATIGRNIAKLTESKDPRTRKKYPQQQAVAIALTQAREDASKRPTLKRELTRLYGKAPNPRNPLSHIPKGAGIRKIRSVVSKNISIEMEAGAPQKQAIAIAISTARADAKKVGGVTAKLIRAEYPEPNPQHTRPEKPRKKKRKTSRPTRPYRRKRSGGGKR